MKFLWGVGVLVALALATTACDKIKAPVPELQKPPAASDPAAVKADERTALAQTAQKELDELRASIAEFRRKAETANQQTQAKLNEEIEILEAELRDLQAKLTELKSATRESWNQLNTSFDQALKTLKVRIADFRQKS